MKTTLEIVNIQIEAMDEKEKNQSLEKERLIKIKKSYQEKIETIEQMLKQLKGVEYSLYYEIVVGGLSINKAVDKVALKYDLSPSTIWKSYYPNIKEQIRISKQLF